MSRSGLLLVLSIVLSLSVIIYSPIIGYNVHAMNLTAETITTPISEININQSDQFKVTFLSQAIYSEKNMTIYIPPNNETSTDNEPYFIVDNSSNFSRCFPGMNCDTTAMTFADSAGYVNGKVVNFTFYSRTFNLNANIEIHFNATPINPMTRLYTNWTGMIGTDVYSTEISLEITPPHLEISDTTLYYNKTRVVYVGDNHSLEDLRVMNFGSIYYGGYAYNVTATAKNLTDNVEILFDETIFVDESIAPWTQINFNWTINAKTLGTSNISITVQDQTGDYNDTINVTVNVVNLTVISSTIPATPNIGEIITIIANITGNASDLSDLFDEINAGISYEAINTTSNNIEDFSEIICSNSDSFIYNTTLSGEDYTVFTCDYIPDRSGFYNLTINVSDSYEYFDAYNLANAQNTSNFTVAFGNINITKTFAMMPSVNETFDTSKGFWEYGETTNIVSDSPSTWLLNESGSIMEKKSLGYPEINILEDLPQSKGTYIEVDIENITEETGIVFRDNGTERYTFFHYGENYMNGLYMYPFLIRKYDNNHDFIHIHGSVFFTKTPLSGFHKFSVYAIENEFIGMVDGSIVVHGFDSSPIEYGKVGLFSKNPATFDNFKVYNIIEPEKGLLLNQTFKIQSFIDILDGDIWAPVNISLSLNDSKIINTSDLAFTSGENVTVNKTMIITWDLETETLGDTNMTINITPAYGTSDTEELNATIVPLLAYPNNTVINYNDHQLLIINVTGFGPSLEGFDGMFSATFQQQYRSYGEGTIYFDFDSDLSDISNNHYVYSWLYQLTSMSGIYDLSFVMENLYSKSISNTTESFFVNYGTVDISFTATPLEVTQGNASQQEIIIKAINGDIRNITFNFTSHNTTLLDISTGNSSNQTVEQISNYMAVGDEISLSWNITAGILYEDYVNVSVSANSTYVLNNATEMKENPIYINATADTTPPRVENVTRQYDLINLKENILVYVDIYDTSTFTAKAEITYPNMIFAENITMQYLSGNTYYAIFPDANVTTDETEFYRIKVYASDAGDYQNASDNKTTFNTTNIYLINYTLNHILFNLGETTETTMSILTVNNNTIDNYNLTMLMKKSGDENDTTLLPNNMTTGYNYTIGGSDPTGAYSLNMNVSKDGNTANISGNFSVSEEYSLNFIKPTTNFREVASMAYLEGNSAPNINVYNARGEQVYSGVSVDLYCANSNKSLIFGADWTFYIYVEVEDDQCQMPASIDGFKTYNLIADASDYYNNSGTNNINILYGTAPPAGGGDDSTSPSSSSPPANFPPQSDPENYTGMEKRSEFFFYVDQKDINIIQGENAEIIANLDNTGDYDLNISITYTSGCCDIGINESYFVKAKNKQSIEVVISSKLSENPESYKLKMTASEGDIEKEETISIHIEKNQLMTSLEYFENDLIRLENIVNAFNAVGIDVSSYLKDIELSKDLISTARRAVASNDLQSLESATAQLEETLDYLDRKTAEQEQRRWILENKYNLAGFIFSMIVFLFIFKSYMLSFILMSLELQQLKSKEFRLAAEEKSTEKEYFTRVIDKETFNKIITEKHKQLTDIRTRIVHIKKSLKKLIHGQRLKAEDLERYKIKKKVNEKIKKKSIFRLPGILSLKSFIISKFNMKSHAKESVNNLNMPVDMAGKSPVSPQAQGPIQMPASNVQQSAQKKSTTSVPSTQSAYLKRTPLQQPEEKILGNEMREIYGETGPAEQPKESFADIKKKINNIFDE